MSTFRTTAISLVLIALALWMHYSLPGWVGTTLGGALFCAAFVCITLSLIGADGRKRAGKLWKEFLDFLYGLG